MSCAATSPTSFDTTERIGRRRTWRYLQLTELCHQIFASLWRPKHLLHGTYEWLRWLNLVSAAGGGQCDRRVERCVIHQLIKRHYCNYSDVTVPSLQVPYNQCSKQARDDAAMQSTSDRLNGNRCDYLIIDDIKHSNLNKSDPFTISHFHFAWGGG